MPIAAKPHPAPQPRAWQRMLSGRRLNLLDPSSLDIEIGDIAHGLARVARWNGQTIGAHIFSVAQHSLLVDHLAGRLQPEVSARARLAVLLHDAAEYVIGDMISPFKAVIGDAYRETETRILDAVMRRFELPAPMTSIARQLAKKADRLAAHLEATQLAGFSAEEALQYFGEKPHASAETLSFVAPWSADEAASRFLARFHQLDGAIRNRGE
jgi:5'-deoxynucleotidase YfbR-like HD superfamily hydrolase